MIEILSIKILLTNSCDIVYIETTYPNPIYPFDKNMVMKFECAKDHAIPFIEKHFNEFSDYEIINTRKIQNVMKLLNISDIIEGTNCISKEHGKKVYDIIINSLKEYNTIQLSFKGINDITSHFFNNAIGNLLKYYTKEELKNRIKIIDINKNDLFLLKRVVDNSFEIFNKRESYENNKNTNQSNRRL